MSLAIGIGLPPGGTISTLMSSKSESDETIDKFDFVSSTESVDNNNVLRRRVIDNEKKEEVKPSDNEQEPEDYKLIEAKAKNPIRTNEPEYLDTFPIPNASLVIIFISIFFRLLVALHSYSGAGVPPIFGDFEAQRHWMEITINVPFRDWYRNTGANELKYWGLDYPPLSAYWAYLTGYM